LPGAGLWWGSVRKNMGSRGRVVEWTGVEGSSGKGAGEITSLGEQ
nr:hypothetical protein [Tanacetum cinerariifolium]